MLKSINGYSKYKRYDFSIIDLQWKDILRKLQSQQPYIY